MAPARATLAAMADPAGKTASPSSSAPLAPPQLLDLVKRSGDYLKGKGIANGRREAEWIFAETLGMTRIDLFTRFDMPLEPGEVEKLRALIVRRGKREPLAYILGSQEFCGLDLKVGPGVLVPRPETGELVERLLAGLPKPATENGGNTAPLPGPRLLDVGTGSGAIALALKKARPDATVLATDRDGAALAIARANAERLALPIDFHTGHLAVGIAGPFAAVAANLPYIGEHERVDCDPELAFEPQHALFAADGGMALIAELLADAKRLLAPGGLMWLEHGWKQGDAVKARAEGLGLACDIIKDSGGKDRIARVTVSQ
jgi:release factor glutamine methyltransferase